MKIKEVEFITSSANLQQCPKSDYPEYAFVGRSNVGKSSLINALANKKKLAKTSGQPGKTQLINHFLVDKSWYLVDLPGYGWAKVSKKLRKGFISLLQAYLYKREPLICVFVLIDSRLPENANDILFLNDLAKNQIPLSIIFTKTDKISKHELENNFEKFKTHRLKVWQYLPDCFFTSSLKKTGMQNVVNYIESVNIKLVDNKKK